MRVAMLVGSLMFGIVSGFIEIGLVDVTGPGVNQSDVQAFEDWFPPPPNWP
jgi:hypothetical protein